MAILILLAMVPEVYANGFAQPDYRVLVEQEIKNYSVDISYDSGALYLPVREIAANFGGKVYWSDKTGVILVYNEETYLPDYYLKDSKAMVSSAYLEKIFGYTTQFFEGYNALTISKSAGQVNESQLYDLLPTYDGYSYEDLEWMAKIIHAEANGENYESKIAVGNVILNRKASALYPDSVKGVIFDTKNGVQFTPIANGAIYNNPSRDSWMAALEVLEGKRNADNALFFINPRYAKSSWVSRNREYAFTMQNHDFYY